MNKERRDCLILVIVMVITLAFLVGCYEVLMILVEHGDEIACNNEPYCMVQM